MRLPLYVAALVWLVVGLTAAHSQTLLINSFETPADLEMAGGWKVDLSQTTQGVTDGQYALQVRFLPDEWRYVTLTPQTPWDWSGYGGMAFDLTNPTSEAQNFHVRVDDDESADGINHCLLGSGSIAAGDTVTFVFPVGADPVARYGMRALPFLPGARSLNPEGNWGSEDNPFDFTHVVGMRLFPDDSAGLGTVILDNVRLEPSVSFLGIVDRYGQYTAWNWPGKIGTDEEFAERRRQEEAELDALPGLPDRDRFGGWKEGPPQSATGFFRTDRIDGKWWLVSPDGSLFFATGIGAINFQAGTFTTGRESMFTWLPEPNDPLYKHVGYTDQVEIGPIKEGWYFDFLRANLERKYGADYLIGAVQGALRRLPSWGFNLVGEYPDYRLFQNGKVPYTVDGVIAGPHARISGGSDRWGLMHDPFDPRFRTSAQTSLRSIVANHANDPWLAGYFIDATLNFGRQETPADRYGLSLAALDAPDSPAGQEIRRQLQTRYGDIAALNSAWKTTFLSWADLHAPALPDPLPDALRKDLADFARALAAEYFRIVREELRKLDPNHLYLGCRFGWYTPEAVEAAALNCDVLSFAAYARALDSRTWNFVNALDRPCIINQFQFGATDRGLFHPGAVAVSDQTARGAQYQNYVRSVVDHPAFVGCLWYTYSDQPVTGYTLNGENANAGFVSVTDTPYPEMVEAARRTHAELYLRRAGR